MCHVQTALPTPRGTHADRRAAAQAALLDAAIESLIENGWAGTTTRAVAERAGLSLGAQQHYYPTKAALIEAAVQRLAYQIAEAALSGVPPTGTERERAEVLITRLWEVNNIPAIRAAHELISVGQRDPEVRPHVVAMLTMAQNLTLDVARQLCPNLMRHPDAEAFVRIIWATMRGTVLIAMPGTENARVDWPTMRSLIMRALDSMFDQPARSNV